MALLGFEWRPALMLFDGEPSLAEALADPVVVAMMRADRVDPQRLKATLMDVARRLASPSRGEPAPDAAADVERCGFV